MRQKKKKKKDSSDKYSTSFLILKVVVNISP